jgi:hypothetical protein
MASTQHGKEYDFRELINRKRQHGSQPGPVKIPRNDDNNQYEVPVDPSIHNKGKRKHPAAKNTNHKSKQQKQQHSADNSFGHSNQQLERKRTSSSNTCNASKQLSLCTRNEEYYYFGEQLLRLHYQKNRQTLLADIRGSTGYCMLFRSHDCCNPDNVKICVNLMYKIACKSSEFEFEETKEIFWDYLGIFDVSCSPFWSGLSWLIRSMPCTTNPPDCFGFLLEVTSIIAVLLQMEDYLPIKVVIRFLPLDELHGSLKQLTDKDSTFNELFEQTNVLLQKRDVLRETNATIAHVSKNPAYAVLPTASELNKSISEFITAGHQITSNKLYLQWHYHLLREDFINPLRNALCKIQDEEDDCKDLKIYENVRLCGKCPSFEGILHKFSFQLPGKIKTNWKHSKRLTYGSLVCLSKDGFHSIVYATVAERKTEELQKNIATLKILSVQVNEFPLISPDDCYIMIESPAYLEAYAPVVSCLKAMLNNPEDLPFDDYLVKKSTSICPPKYLQGDKTMNLSGVVCKCLDKDCTHKAVSVCNESSWCDLPCTNLDESQLKALQLALTSKLPLIQGPPGTGKTYVGVCLVKALLLNKELWNPTKNAPLLIMCYTNHALDQFLCELLQLNMSKIPKILRIGGRSKNEDIKKLNVRYHLPKHHNSRKYRWDKHNLMIVLDALNSLCNGKQYHSMDQHIYCSFLLPSEIETCPELASQIFQDHADFTVQNVLNFFEIKISSLPIASHAITDAIDNDTFHHSIFEENIRRIDDEHDSDLLANDDILQMAMHDDQIKHLFERVAMIEPFDHTRSNKSKMTLRKKQELFKYYLCERYKTLNEQYQTQSEEIQQKEDELILATLRTADIIGLTTTGASKYNRIIKRLHSKVLIVEEAAEVMEGQIVAALTKHTQHMILIGDHKQLRPKTNDYTIGKKYGLEISLFERLMNNMLPSVQLKYQHRMRPEISRLISPHIYEELLDHESVRNYEEIRGMKSSLFFFNHSQKESEVEDLKSPKNQFEALMIAKLANYLLKQGYTTSDITVLTPYTGQVICIKREFTSIGIRGIRIVPIDHFQGEENEIILLSLVRTNKIGFVKEENRICVALSRAKKGFYCIGNFNFLNRQSPLLERIVQSLTDTNFVGDSLSLQCKTHKNITEILSPEDFSKVKEGGCSEMCGHRLKCGHICPSLCHPNEDIHNDECKKQCSKIICKNGHQCPLACYKQCEPCHELVLKEIPTCQHEQYVQCFINPADFLCQEDVLKELKCGHSVMGKCGVEHKKDCMQLVLKDFPCGHKAQIECYRSPQFYACRFKCQKVLGCGHVCSGKCGTCNQGRTHIPCMKPCTRILFCGHKCTSKTCCADECPPCKEICTLSCSHGPCGHKCNELCIKCAEPCEWKCPHYKCTKPCGEMCDRPPCDKSCEKKLKCGHPCLGLCGEVCPELCRTCDPENEAFQIFFGSEDEAESRFIMLQDCKLQHIFEVKGLDELVCDQKKDIDSQIQLKSCPKCKTVIKRSFRYANIIKSIKNDMNQIKEKITHKLNPSERQKLSKEAIELNGALNRKNRNLSDSILKISSDAFLLSRHALLMAEYECNKLLLKKSQISNSLDKDRFWCQVECFIRFLQSNYCQRLPCLPTQVFHDISNERNRLLLLFEIYKLKDDFDERNLRPPSSLFCRLASQSAFGNSQFSIAISLGQVDCRDWQYIEEVQKVINPLNGILEDDSKIKNDEFVKHLTNIKEIRKRYSLDGLTDEELKTIVKAIGGKKGSWYKCPNGHIYNIGECGGATVEGRCNECNERIGGRNHRLLETNSHANIDGSQHPAWSEQANLANYEF